jgi:hypothetical protein
MKSSRLRRVLRRRGCAAQPSVTQPAHTSTQQLVWQKRGSLHFSVTSRILTIGSSYTRQIVTRHEETSADTQDGRLVLVRAEAVLTTHFLPQGLPCRYIN